MRKCEPLSYDELPPLFRFAKRATLRGWIILSNSHIELLRENFLKDFAHTFQKTRKKREIMKIKPHYFSLLRKIRKSVSMDKVEILFKYLILPFWENSSQKNALWPCELRFLREWACVAVCHVRKAGPPVARSASPRTFLSNSPQPRRPVKNMKPRHCPQGGQWRGYRIRASRPNASRPACR